VKITRSFKITILICIVFLLIIYYFPRLFGVSLIKLLKDNTVFAAEAARFNLQYALTREKLTLTVDVDQTDVILIQVYSGSYQDIAGNPSGNLVFPKAKLIAEKDISSPGKITFQLKPGRYFIYPWIKTRTHGFSGLPTLITLDRDMVVKPNYRFGY
jgi:hypothetical protein